MKSTPCEKDCPGRTPGCHSQCENYKAFIQERRAKGKYLRSEADKYFRDRSYRQIRKLINVERWKRMNGTPPKKL
jgi:hypothetical protein